MLQRSFLILMIFCLFSCGKSTDEKTTSAVLSATIFLSKGDCQSAIDVLEENGRQDKNAHYLKTLSSAYACRAKYSAVTFFANDLGLTTNPAPFGGSSIYSTSLSTVATTLQNDFYFRDMQTAIDILLYAGGIPTTLEPTSLERSRYFTSDEAADIDSQLLFMMFAQLGKYMHYYGNGNAAGLKGAGTAGNKCFTSYNITAIVNPTLAALPATCKGNPGSPHSDLSITIPSAATRKTRLCQGVVLLNGIFDIIPSVLGSATGTLATQSAAITIASTAIAGLLKAADPSIGEVASTVNQTICEDNTHVPVAKIETYFSYMFEDLFLP